MAADGPVSQMSLFLTVFLTFFGVTTPFLGVRQDRVAITNMLPRLICYNNKYVAITTPFLGVRQDRVVLVLWFGDYFRNFRGG